MLHASSHTFSALRICRILLALLFVPTSLSAEEPEAPAEQRTFVETKVLPLLEARCFECHGGGQKPKGGLILSNREFVLQGGDSGPSIVPGKPDESRLIEAIRYEGLEMPPRSKMPDAEIAIFETWVKQGAPWPADLQVAHAAGAPAPAFPLNERRDSHWAWQPIQDPAPPEVSMTAWPADPVDQFVLARLEAASLQPASNADRPSLIRRLSLDLTGLLPAPEEIRAFVDDPAEDRVAAATVVDRLLRSSHFGERWARHWLDLVRYAETLGHEFDYPLHHAWQYRDYVIRAFNADVPYNEFVREQIAGDLLPAPRHHPTELYNESLIGTGFWSLHEDKHAPVDVAYDEAIKIDNQIDVFARTFMGLTVACARCHDHKFDAISTKDYYALFGVLQSTRRRTGWLDSGNRINQLSEQLVGLRSRADTIVAQLQQQDRDSGVAVRYANATIDLFRGQPGPGEKPTADIPHLQRSVTAVAKETGCDPILLQAWASWLGNADSRQVSERGSLLARIAQTPPGTDVDNAVTQWKHEVLHAVNDTSCTESFADFSHGLPAGWSTTGPAFAGPARATVAAGAHEHRTAEAGFSSVDLSDRFGGSLYSPTFELTHPEILIRIAGEGARVRLVIEGYVMAHFNGLLFRGIDQKVDTKGEFQWLRIGGDTHRYTGRNAYLEIMDEGDGWFVIDEVHFVKQGNGARSKVDVPASSRTLATTLQQDPTSNPVATSVAFAWPELFARELLPSSSDEQWTALRAAWAKASADAARPIPVLAVTDGTGEDQHVFIRGNHRNLGELSSRSFLTAIAGPNQTPIESGSGRRELAQRLLADDNPFPARVAVNRIWHHLFGRGIVASTDDFGVLGERPSHPQLLDHLATRFRKDGWSIKRLIRQLVLSRTYRMSSVGSPEAPTIDPGNVLLHSSRVRRLQGEIIRDLMLQLAGQLDSQMHGPSVPVALTDFMQGRGRPKSGPLDGNGRRSIYISVNRNFLSPFMLAFDTPSPMSTRGRRAVSNVPAQALILLNDEFAHQQSQRWAAKLLTASTETDHVIRLAWQEALGRVPSEAELSAVRRFAQTQATHHAETVTASTIGEKTMQDICHAIMNTKEFVYVR